MSSKPHSIVLKDTPLMSTLQIIYISKGTESVIELLNDTNRDQCKFIEDFNLQENDEIKIDNKEQDIEHHLNLYQKINNLYIFSVYSVVFGNFANLDYPYFLIWSKDTNTFCYVQNGEKTRKIVDDPNNIDFPDNSLFIGIFRKSPDYYLDVEEDREPFTNLIDLPKKAYKTITTEVIDNDSVPKKAYISITGVDRVCYDVPIKREVLNNKKI